MNNIRAKFEEIWPVPKRIYWSESRGEYMPQDDELEYLVNTAIEWDSRLETFTRCQEAMAPVMSLVDEMVMEIEGLAIAAYGCIPHQSQDIVDRAQDYRSAILLCAAQIGAAL